MPEPYELSARFYDRIYVFKRYQEEAEAVRGLIAARCPTASTLLEVGCGTGGHLAFLREWFDSEGVDLSATMLDIARQKLPGTTLHQADMRSFTLPKRFDVVACLFSSIGYVRSLDEMQTAIANLTRHLNPGGLLIVEPWFTPGQWRTPGQVRGESMVDQPDLKIARFVVSETHGRIAVTPMHHLIAQPEGVHHFVERHELFLATATEYADALTAAHLERVTFEADVLPRGAWVGNLPQPDARSC